MGRGVLIGIAGLLLSCSSPTNVQGRVAGVHLLASDALFVNLTSPVAGPPRVAVILTSSKDLCAALRRDRLPAGASFLTIELERVAADTLVGLETDVGGYEIVNPGSTRKAGRRSLGIFHKLDNRCLPGTIPPKFAISGAVKVDQLDAELATGSFELLFQQKPPLSAEDPEEFKGIFSAHFCEVPGGVPVTGCE